jgi:hypothetical protein
MAASILAGLMKTDKETKKSLESINITLQKIYKLDLDKERREKKEKNDTKQAEKRREKQRNVLLDILHELKKDKKGKDKEKKSFFDKIKDTLLGALGGFIGLFKPGGALLTGLGAFANIF